MMSRAQNIAFVCPRFAEGPTVGGAETLMKTLAGYAVRAGRKVTFLTTCATNHFTWANELEPGVRERDGMSVHFFPVDDDRNVDIFLRVQQRISRGAPVTDAEEDAWLQNSVNSRALCEHLRNAADAYDVVVMGPYLFGVVYHAAQIAPSRTVLVPCLHDEPFAYIRRIREMFLRVCGCLFNSGPERGLAARLFGEPFADMPVVGMGIEPFAADREVFALSHRLSAPYLIYCGRREPLKGTPLLMDYLEAFRSRTGRDVKLVLTGSGVVDVPDSLQGHVIDAGFLSEDDKHNAMAGAVAFCHPSVNESFGIVLLEAWLAGTSALVHAGSDVLRDQCVQSNGGLWFRSYPEFEESMLSLLDNEALRNAMAEAGRRYVLTQYSPEQVSGKLLKALDAVAAPA